jgi:glycosyltransferase involved in cell wall biosynthesis
MTSGLKSGSPAAEPGNEARAFTVFTPTFNRAHTIHRVYESLCAQTLRNFEWLIVDDGSTDDTATLVKRWQQEAPFPIRYFVQDHAGKHIAHNRALREAHGTLFTVLDSDDACVPRALERIVYHWNSIPEGRRSEFCGVAGLCQNQRGEIVGDRFPSEPLDIDLREKKYVHHVRGEKWGADLTSILRRFPFPEISTTYLPEGAVWLEIGKFYKLRCVNEILRTYYIDDKITGKTLTKTIGLKPNAPGNLYYYTWILNNDLKYFFHSPAPFLKAALMLPVAALCVPTPLGSVLASLNSVVAKMLVAVAVPLSLVLYAADRLRGIVEKENAD